MPFAARVSAIRGGQQEIHMPDVAWARDIRNFAYLNGFPHHVGREWREIDGYLEELGQDGLFVFEDKEARRMKPLAAEIFAWIARIGANPNDDEDVRLRKSLLVVCSAPFVFAGFAWGLM